MADQVQRILEGRELNRLPVPEETVPQNSIAPALIEHYNPQTHSSESALASFTPRITPDATVNGFESFLEKPRKLKFMCKSVICKPISQAD